MTLAFEHVRLGSVLERIKDEVLIKDDATYSRLTIRMNGRGIDIRDTLLGFEIGTKRQFVAASGQLVLSKIDARNGAFGVLPPHCDNAIITGNFWAFDVDEKRLLPKYFDYLTKTPMFLDFCIRSSEGTTNRRYLQEDAFLAQQIPLPPLDEQRHIVARIEELAAKVDEALGLRAQAIAEAPLLVDAFLRERFATLEQQYGVVMLDEVLVDATYGTSEKSHGERAAGALPVLRIPNVASEKLDLTNLKYAALEDRAVASLAICDDDILIVRTNGSVDLVGRSAVVRGLVEPTLFASYLIRLRFDRTRLVPDFAQIGLRHLRRSGALVDFARTTAGQYNVSIGRLRGAALPVAPIPEQHRLIAELDALQAKIDAVKALQTETAAELDAMLPAILDKAFKGEL